ncbi:hypothetical protein K438DRAFT_1961053 [Mycena galopus ATCC 62051]|nr:hypothetical protein K438DRAFT_1961053 [Mycena galopus ATCC 62051]
MDVDCSRLDILEELDLVGIGDIDDDVDGGIDFIALPRLRQLIIRVYSNSSQILMLWAQLTDLSLFIKMFNIALDILSCCPNLIRASITTRASWDELPQGRKILAFPHLYTLSVTFFGAAEYVTPFFNNISATVLQDLCVHSSTSHAGRWTEAHFMTFQLRAPHFTSLEFSNSDFTSDDLRAAILHTPSLIHLDFSL